MCVWGKHHRILLRFVLTHLCQERLGLFLTPRERTTRSFEFGAFLGSVPWGLFPGLILSVSFAVINCNCDCSSFQ